MTSNKFYLIVLVIFNFLISFQLQVYSQSLYLEAGYSKATSPDFFISDYNIGYNIAGGVGIKISNHYELQIMANYSKFNFEVEGYERYEILSYHPFESEKRYYSAAGGDFYVYGISSHLKINVLSFKSIQPYINPGIGLSYRRRGEIKTTPISVFNRKTDTYAVLPLFLGLGLEFPIVAGNQALIEYHYVTLGGLGGDREFYSVNLGFKFGL
jgi:hypothetical protein